MGSLGVLERLLMDLLWSAERPLTANELRDALLDPANSGTKPLAITTVLTVLSRLENKGFVTRDRDIRPHGYSAVSTRAEHTAELMHEVLGTTSDRTATLARFIGNVSPQEARTLRELLASIGPSSE
ncbi:BlaI/MecI/CopY family transcriptional regulator [Cryobacterium sp.]|jgi:predicted transcriptional regulator|uniref:BlaI/MecI/CopY family transcriptional regulator n=1 Tax=Cryobacterium sp. TaxID=1926290 RepID=UPI00260BA5ED|nr:BlaI/MecI/CopY family transcriptional regulator [Cryobacterium sp.]MCU1446247.1 transcriptional regulator [Cryobacterium sp.]